MYILKKNFFILREFSIIYFIFISYQCFGDDNILSYNSDDKKLTKDLQNRYQTLQSSWYRDEEPPLKAIINHKKDYENNFKTFGNQIYVSNNNENRNNQYELDQKQKHNSLSSPNQVYKFESEKNSNWILKPALPNYISRYEPLKPISTTPPNFPYLLNQSPFKIPSKIAYYLPNPYQISNPINRGLSPNLKDESKKSPVFLISNYPFLHETTPPPLVQRYSPPDLITVPPYELYPTSSSLDSYRLPNLPYNNYPKKSYFDSQSSPKSLVLSSEKSNNQEKLKNLFSKSEDSNFYESSQSNLYNASKIPDFYKQFNNIETKKPLDFSFQSIKQSKSPQPETPYQPFVQPKIVQPETQYQPFVPPKIVQPETPYQPFVQPKIVQPETQYQPYEQPQIYNKNYFLTTSFPSYSYNNSYNQSPFSEKVAQNSVQGQPTVMCTDNYMFFRINTRFPFTGQIFTYNRKRVPNCQHTFNQATNVSVSFSYVECGIKNSQNESALQAQFHLQIIVLFKYFDKTTTIQSYVANCFQRKILDIEQTVTRRIEEALEELNLVSTYLEQKATVPDCSLRIVTDVENHNQGDGIEVNEVDVGQPLRIEFGLQPESAAFGFLVKNCVVRDFETGEQHEVIDQKGCSPDLNIFAHPQYDMTQNIARVHLHAFKLPDHTRLSLTCQYIICLKMSEKNDTNSCDKLPTPPYCADIVTSPINSILFDAHTNYAKVKRNTIENNNNLKLFNSDLYKNNNYITVHLNTSLTKDNVTNLKKENSIVFNSNNTNMLKKSLEKSSKKIFELTKPEFFEEIDLDYNNKNFLTQSVHTNICFGKKSLNYNEALNYCNLQSFKKKNKSILIKK